MKSYSDDVVEVAKVDQVTNDLTKKIEDLTQALKDTKEITNNKILNLNDEMNIRLGAMCIVQLIFNIVVIYKLFH